MGFVWAGDLGRVSVLGGEWKADGAVEQIGPAEVVPQLAAPIGTFECLLGPGSASYAGSDEQDGRVDLASWLKAVSIFAAPSDRA